MVEGCGVARVFRYKGKGCAGTEKRMVGRCCIRARLNSRAVDIVRVRFLNRDPLLNREPLLNRDPLVDLHAYVCAAIGFIIITGIKSVDEFVHFVQ
jgi:hypothetical protein